MIELLRRVADVDPDRVAVLTHERATTYADLVAAGGGAAAWLTEEGITRFAHLDPDAHVAVPLLAGASLAGVQMCQYPPDADVASLARRLDHEVVLGGAASVLDAPSPALGRARPPRTGRPHLVLTTGTTGDPRGVRHDWDRLLRPTARIAPSSDQRWLLAYGLHQFAGLQTLLHVFAAGATLVAPTPRRPREGLSAMRTLGVTHASATPTYWRFLLAGLRTDGGPTPPLQQITLGGEAVSEPLIGQLAETFPDAHVSQVYAASEFGATGSVRDRRAGLPTEVLDRGDDADVAMDIVDGELWVRSRVGMLGYHRENLVEPDAWRPTGDLVEVVGDRIHFRGRTSEIINVGGIKVHPLPIEERVSAVADVEIVRVFGRPNPVSGAIVAVEVVVAPGADPDRIRDEVRAACEDLAPAARPRSVKLVDTVATAGDKVTRRAS